ncbi:MAG: hypothetical protein RL377_554 [Bacteroidota bacterium]|jgi:uncharacterized membrane protein YgdD (TMEM256/DUF423 family)
MARNLLLWGLILAMASVALGAFGAHGLKQLVSADKVAIFETGVRYQFMHALALIFLGLYITQNENHANHLANTKGLLVSARFFLVGILFFSGSLYLLSLQSLCSYNYSKIMGPITPIGGLFFMLGWGTWIRLVWLHKVDK